MNKNVKLPDLSFETDLRSEPMIYVDNFFSKNRTFKNLNWYCYYTYNLKNTAFGFKTQSKYLLHDFCNRTVS